MLSQMSVGGNGPSPAVRVLIEPGITRVIEAAAREVGFEVPWGEGRSCHEELSADTRARDVDTSVDVAQLWSSADCECRA